MTPNSIEHLDTAKTLADFLKVSVPAIRKWTRFGLPHIRCGRVVRYNREAVLAYLQERQAEKSAK